MKRVKLISLFILLALTFSNLGAAQARSTAWQTKVDPWVFSTAQGGETEFFLFLTEQADLSGAAQLKTKLEKGAYVYERLREVAGRTQSPLISALDAQGVDYRPYWVANMILVRGDSRLIQALAQRAEVAHLYANPSVHFNEPANPLPLNNEHRSPQAPDAVEWNLTKIGAPDVWAAGYRGQGVVIGGQDTGYDWNHPALKNQYRGWNGSTIDPNYNWHDAIHDNNPHTSPGNPCGFNAAEPCDDSAHGTHTMGTMVGDDGGGNQVGVAPAARWIGCRNMEQNWGSPATYSECYQWFIAPTDSNGQNPRPDLAPDIINNSWSCPPDEGCTDPNMLLEVVKNVRAAGILSVHAAGNSGSGCSSISSPAAIYDESFTVGNTDRNDNINHSSSRGPVTIDGSGRLKPDISAPGTDIRSSVPGGNYGTLSGTSMAGPHVAGLAALVISANPSLAGHPDQIENLIEQSAVHLKTSQTCGAVSEGSIPNNTFGWGRIDAWAAYQGHMLSIQKTASASKIEPGNTLTYTLSITHTALKDPTHHVTLSDILPANTNFVSATLPHQVDGNLIRWNFDSLGANESRSVELVVQVPITSTGTVENRDYSVRSDEVSTPVSGAAVITPIVPAPGVALSPDQAAAVLPGSAISYTHTLTNTSSTTDTFDLSLESSQGWTSLSSSTPVVLEPGESAPVVLDVTVPSDAPAGSQDTAILIARSQNNPTAFARITGLTSVLYRFYLPFIPKETQESASDR